MKGKILLLALLLFITGCKQEIDGRQISLDKAKGYYESLIEADLDKQMEYLEAFSLDPEEYFESFLKYVEGGKLHELSIEYEDDLLVMVKLDMDLELSSDFPSNPSLESGTNRVIRYLSYYKTDDYRLKEILNKPIY